MLVDNRFFALERSDVLMILQLIREGDFPHNKIISLTIPQQTKAIHNLIDKLILRCNLSRRRLTHLNFLL